MYNSVATWVIVLVIGALILLMSELGFRIGKNEKVSPTADRPTGVVQAAAGGTGITYLANAPTEAEPQGNANEVQVLSRREGPAWSSRDIAIPHQAATGASVEFAG